MIFGSRLSSKSAARAGFAPQLESLRRCSTRQENDANFMRGNDAPLAVARRISGVHFE
jgi:hypothetical protein